MNWCVVHPCANSLGEGPHWDARGQSLWWVDVVTSKLWRFTPSTDTVDSWTPRGTPLVSRNTAIMISMSSAATGCLNLTRQPRTGPP